MADKKFEAILALVIPQVVNLIVRNHQISETEAIKDFYSSQVFSVLEREETKVWHFSTLTLYNMYDEERKNGSFEFPEEV